MTGRLFFIILIVVSSCQTSTADWATVDFGTFKLKVPRAWHQFKEQGVDAYIGGITDGRDSLWFYYGWYISGPRDEESNKQLYGQDTINGFSAVIVVPKKDSIGRMELFIPNVTAKDKFALSGYNIQDPKTVVKIFKTVTFANSDTSKNGVFDASKLREYPFGSGRTLYYGFCAPCHPINKIIDGASINELLEERDPEWVYKFLTNRQLVASDSLHQARLKAYGAHCMQFDNLSKRDVELIVGYLKGE